MRKTVVTVLAYCVMARGKWYATTVRVIKLKHRTPVKTMKKGVSRCGYSEISWWEGSSWRSTEAACDG